MNEFQTFFEKLRSLQEQTNCFRVLLEDEEAIHIASKQAIAVKDCFQIEGQPCSWGVSPPIAHLSSHSAEIVAHLKECGFQVVASTNLDPLGISASGENSFYGDVVLPNGRPALGSSGGSGVVAASGLVIAALGTDIGGSIRLPAAANSIYGFKTSPGLLPRAGVYLYHSQFDCIGVLSKSAQSLREFLDTALPSFEKKYSERSIPSLLFVPHRSEVSLLSTRQQELWQDHLARYRVVELSKPFFQQAFLLYQRVMPYVLRDFLDKSPWIPEHARSYLAPHLPTAQETSEREDLEGQRERLCAELSREVPKSALICTPTLRDLPPESIGAAREALRKQLHLFLPLANLAGYPALALPSNDLSIQLIGRENCDSFLLASALQQASNIFSTPTAEKPS